MKIPGPNHRTAREFPPLSFNYGNHQKPLIELPCLCLCLVTQLGLTLCDPVDCSSPGSSVHGDPPGKNTGVGCHALLQGICPNQESNPGLPHCRWILYYLSYQRSPELLHDPAIPPQGIYPEKNMIRKDIYTTMFIEALFTITKAWKQLKCPSTEEWIKKMWYVYTMEYFLIISNNEIMHLQQNG